MKPHASSGRLLDLINSICSAVPKALTRLRGRLNTTWLVTRSGP